MALKKGQNVRIKAMPGKTGTIQQVLPNPFSPSWLNWLIRPNYLVVIHGELYPDVFTWNQLELV